MKSRSRTFKKGEEIEWIEIEPTQSMKDYIGFMDYWNDKFLSLCATPSVTITKVEDKQRKKI